MQLDNTVVEQLRTPVYMTWEHIAPDAGELVSSNEEALEMVLDANRMAVSGYDEADRLVQDLASEHGFGNVIDFLSAQIRLY